MTEPQLPFLGPIIVELRTDVDLRALVSTRVRGFRPQGGENGDVQPAGHYKRFVVLSILSAPVEPSLPITFAEVAARCYGTDDTDAWTVWAALVKAIHAVGPRVKDSGLGIYRTAVLTGGVQDSDPDTDQPMVTGSFQVIATTQVVV
ncbi:MAG TPA: hypothetical protein VI341_13595 [Actinomycetota bacterium]